jgi:hypothetical protein
MKGLAGGHPQGRLIAELNLTAEQCYRYCLSLPITSQVVGITSMEQLREDIKLARNFQPMSKADMVAFRLRVREVATDGRHELFKSTKNFDGPHHRRQHGFDV